MWLYEAMAVVCTTESDQTRASAGWDRPCYRDQRRRLKTLYRCRTDPVCYRLYQALFCYRNGQYDRCITLVQKSKDTISTLRSVYRWNLGQEMYTEAGGEELPLPAIMRTAVIDIVRVGKDRLIPELYIEIYSCPVSVRAQKLAIAVPPLVFALFLQYLSYNQVGYFDARDETLDELSQVVLQNSGHLVYQRLNTISWQIFGLAKIR